MKYVHPEIEKVFNTDSGRYSTLVIESQALFCRLIGDISRQIQGYEGDGVLSRGDTTLPMSRYAELLDRFVPFDMNQKALLTRVTGALERDAAAPENFEQTSRVLRDVENLFDSLTFAYPCDIVFSKVSIGSLLKACAPAIRSDAVTCAEQLLDYMELVYSFDRQKLFFTVNLRSYIADEEMELFVQTALSHGYHMIGIECTEHPRLPSEDRVVIDSDLCEF